MNQSTATLPTINLNTMSKPSTILVTGAAGFIGFHVARALCQRGDTVIGLDNLNPYYDPQLKRDRLAQLNPYKQFTFRPLDLADRQGMTDLFEEYTFDRVVHLGAQAGVRYSIDHPDTYIQSNIVGFLHVLEGCRQQHVNHLVFASSSSVYGANHRYPYRETDSVDHPISLYAATKKSNELMAHSYAHLYQLPCTGLRFFTVYGPWGRPDMAVYRFTEQLLADQPISLFNDGKLIRDFTYIDDVVTAVLTILDCPATPDPQWSATMPSPASSNAPYCLYNIGHQQPTLVSDLIRTLEKQLGKRAQIHTQPNQAGDVLKTHADTRRLKEDYHYQPATTLETGIAEFIRWYQHYHHVKASAA